MKKLQLLFIAILIFAIAIFVAGCSATETTDPATEPEVSKEEPTPEVPVENLSYYDNYVGPDTCKGCHTDQMAKWETSWHTKKATEGPAIMGGLDNVWEWVPAKWDEMDSYLILDQKDKETLYVSTTKSAIDDIAYVIGNVRKQRYTVYYDGGPQEAWLSTTEDGGISWTIDKSTTVQFEGNKERAGYNFLTLELHNEEDIRGYGEFRSWQERCISCHTTGFNPDAWAEAKEEFINGEREDLKDIFVATVAISCESCHGPGKDHAGGPSPENIINPAKLDKDDETRQLVCGQCHTRTQKNLLYEGSHDNRGFKLGETAYMEVMQYTRPAWGTGNRQVSIDGKGRRDHQQDMDMKLQDYIDGGATIHGQQACFDCHDSHNVGNNPDNLRTKGESPIDNCLTCHSDDAEERMLALNGAEGWESFGFGNWDNEGGRKANKQHMFNLDEEGRTFGLTPEQYIWAQVKDGNPSEVDGWESIWPWEIEYYEDELGQETYIGAEPWNQ